ncbi:unnamed protein product [Nippostrongylus brasiliensis]|uniref:Nucleotide-diphospho-sugar transferase domain-containing protein n=1 Tax=Nippostrongylus brasiliensis TaxID=27835 RepID=A0A3P7AP22_NIPBR|nr:unnamed protein product [Nippostrongylus brasiliensis]
MLSFILRLIQFQFFFQRHCITAQILANNSYSWILFLDSDIGVVNENRTIEEYIRKDADIIFYDRFYNFEITAGTYLAKKSPFAIGFLLGWANFVNRLSVPFSGTDNGAIHMYMTEIVAPNSSLLRRCWKMYNNTVDYGTLWTYTLCCREAMKNSSFKKIFIYEKNSLGTFLGYADCPYRGSSFHILEYSARPGSPTSTAGTVILIAGPLARLLQVVNADLISK